MINFNKLAGIVLLLALTGCGRAAQYSMGKGEDIAREAKRNEFRTAWSRSVVARQRENGNLLWAWFLEMKLICT